MEEGFFYYIDDSTGKLNRFSVEQDEYVENPRNDFCIGKMNLANGFGDKEFPKQSWSNSMIDFITEHYDAEKVFDYINENIENVSIKKNENETFTYEFINPMARYNRIQELIEETTEVGQDSTGALGDILEYLSEDELEKVLFQFPKENLCILPIYDYSYSSETEYSTQGGKYVNNLGSIGGFIYCDFADVMLNFKCITPENWRETAEKCLISEVETFSEWARGDVYSYQIQEGTPFFAPATDKVIFDWDYKESCGGYFSNEYGEDLINEVAENAGYGKVQKFNDIPEFLRKTTNIENFQENLKKCVNSISQTAKAPDEKTFQVASKTLMDFMPPMEKEKFTSLVNKKGLKDGNSLTQYLTKMYNDEVSFAPKKRKTVTQDVERER